ncbi:hypothetical protein HDU98_006818 [Podochytrium sp. JEL0797]|nr:hypothetical protein HDU98_006818 [Podochytrium sp. JEL0797]
MSTRTFIHDALYNPHYGYFSRNATIFSLPNDRGIDVSKLKDNLAFMNTVAEEYQRMEESGVNDESVRQVWHTPTELFKPHYGNALANYILKTHGPTNPNPLKIYEIGAGNGTLAKNMLDFIQQRFPNVYARTEYTIVEISSKLAGKQRKRMLVGDQLEVEWQGHPVTIVNQSIFDWNQRVEEPCFVVAMEVIDNFSHDLIRYQQHDGTPVQGVVLVDHDGDYQEAFEPLSDPLIQRYLSLRDKWTGGKRSEVLHHPVVRKLRGMIPGAPNLSEREFLPTMNMLFLEKLHSHFPNHRLIVSDFSDLPDTLAGHCSPVVQTRYRGGMVACSTYLVQQGFFDVFFPTDFEAMRELYCAVGEGRKGDVRVVTQREFLEENAVGVEACTTRSGEVPMLEYYQNFKFLLS